MEHLMQKSGASERPIRPAALDDLDELLRLNAQWEHVTSFLDHDALAHLHANAAYHRVAELDSSVVAFLLALAPGADYESPNYRWFDARSDGFLYIDRVIVDRQYQRAGLGDALYDDLIAFARSQGVARLVCEVDIEPHNVASDAFHERRGFVEVGAQQLEGGKRVSLRELKMSQKP